MNSSLVLVLAIFAGAIVALIFARWIRGWRGSRKARVRAARAIAGEGGAVVLLRDAGFTIVAAQARIWWSPLVDGEPHQLELRADYLVEQDGALFVAEVKTGEQAPRLSTAATRRQLLEYQVAFATAYGAEGVLLVCPESGTIHRVEFPLPARRGAVAGDDLRT